VFGILHHIKQCGLAGGNRSAPLSH
jgi:hypothetical protein